MQARPTVAPRRSRSSVRRLAGVLGLGLLALAVSALPAAAQEPFPRICGFEPTESADFCAHFGLAFDREDCKCKPHEIEWPNPNGVYDLCDFTPEAANQICRSRGMYFNPVTCSCMTIRLVPRQLLPEIPRHWWDALPQGVVVPKFDRLQIHRGEGLFINTPLDGLETAIDLMLEGASVPDLEAHGFEVTEAEAD